MKRWYAVHTHVRGEETARDHLERQGFPVYLPHYRKQRRHARRTETVAVPLFPRYLFVEVDLDNQRWRSILSTVGVSYLVCHGDQPTPIAPEIIEGLKAREDEEGWVRLKDEPPFRKGDRVNVTTGPLSGIEAIVLCRGDKDRVTVLLNLLGRSVAARVSLDKIAIPS